MDLLKSALFVVGGIVVGTWFLDIFVLGNSGDALPQNERMGEWRKAEIRTQCYNAVAEATSEPDRPKRPETVNIDIRDYNKILDMTAALHCYVVTNPNAICNKDNRAYIVDYVGRYFKKKQSMLADAEEQGKAEASAMAALWDSQRNQAISAALDEDVKVGKLKRDDFGWFVPSALETAFEKYPGATDSCVKQG